MRRICSTLAIAALIASAPASAGEIGGNGNSVPGGVNGSSECSYSGLNDTPLDLMGFTQTFASFWRYVIGFMDPSAPWHPGNSCRGN